MAGRDGHQPGNAATAGQRGPLDDRAAPAAGHERVGAEEKAVDQLIAQLRGDAANSGRAGAFVLDRSGLRVEVGDVDDVMQDAPETLSVVAGKLAAAAAADDESEVVRCSSSIGW